MAQREYQRILPFFLHPENLSANVHRDAAPAFRLPWRSIFRRNRFIVRNMRGHERSTHAPAEKARLSLRRVFEVTCVAAGLVVLAPLFAAIALAIKLDDGGPVFYSHFRVGKGLKKFRLLKFRSMIVSPAEGSPVTAPQDVRITRVGRVLRIYKLDELPQLINVLKGDMQLVGSRPQMEKHVEMFREEYEELLRAAPGITDLATLTFRNEERFFHEGSIEEQYIKKIMPMKLQLALKYARTRTFVSDLEIIVRTIFCLNPAPFARRHGGGGAGKRSLAEYFAKHVSWTRTMHHSGARHAR